MLEVLTNLNLSLAFAANKALPLIVPVSQHDSLLWVEEWAIRLNPGYVWCSSIPKATGSHYVLVFLLLALNHQLIRYCPVCGTVNSPVVGS